MLNAVIWLFHSLLRTGLAWCVAAIPFASAAQHIVSLDLCSDWLLAYHATAGQSITLSPQAHRYPLPFTAPSHTVHDGSLERIMSLKPDAVLVSEFNASMLRKRLQALGVQVVSTPLPHSMEDLDQLSNTVLTLLGQTSKFSTVQTKIRPKPDNNHGRLLLLGANGYGVGRNTLEHSLITQAGWSNYVSALGYVRLDMEMLVTYPPDAILTSTFRNPAMANAFAQHPALQRAISTQRWIQTDDWRWECPGPWMLDLIEQLQP